MFCQQKALSNRELEIKSQSTNWKIKLKYVNTILIFIHIYIDALYSLLMLNTIIPTKRANSAQPFPTPCNLQHKTSR